MCVCGVNFLQDSQLSLFEELLVVKNPHGCNALGRFKGGSALVRKQGLGGRSCIPEEDKEKSSQWRLCLRGQCFICGKIGALFANCLKAPFFFTLAGIRHFNMLML